MPELSVIVCTHDRPDELRRCLSALAELDDPVEVVVVDSASPTPCAPLVEAFRERIGRLVHLRMDEPGLSLARNAGIAVASGDIIAFVDDDAAPAADWAAALLRSFAADPTIGCVGGACTPDFAAERPSWMSDRLLTMSGITRFGSRAREPRSSAEWPFGANIAFRREALAQAGGFSPRLGRHGGALRSGEDSDMVARVAEFGWRIWLEPAAVVAHRVSPERCRSGYYWRRLWWNGISRAVDPSPRVALRLLVAVPVRLVLWSAVRDRMYLYRVAETAGYFAARLGRAGGR